MRLRYDTEEGEVRGERRYWGIAIVVETERVLRRTGPFKSRTEALQALRRQERMTEMAPPRKRIPACVGGRYCE